MPFGGVGDRKSGVGASGLPDRLLKEVKKKVRGKEHYLTISPMSFYQSATFNH